jgi:hypothetical protein
MRLAGIRTLDHPTFTLISIVITLYRMPFYLKNKKNTFCVTEASLCLHYEA